MNNKVTSRHVIHPVRTLAMSSLSWETHALSGSGSDCQLHFLSSLQGVNDRSSPLPRPRPLAPDLCLSLEEASFLYK